MDFIPERRKKIGEIFLAMGLASEDDLKMALSYQQQHPNKRLGVILSEAGVLSNEDIAIALAKQHKLQYINLSKFILDPKLTDQISEDLIAELYFVPLKQLGGNMIIAIDDPTDASRLEKITTELGGNITFVVSSTTSVSKLLTDIIYRVKTKSQIRKKAEAQPEAVPVTKKIQPAAESDSPETPDGQSEEPVPQPAETVDLDAMDAMMEDFSSDQKVFDQFLKKLKDLSVPVQIFLQTGTTLQGGVIIAFDNEAIYLKEKKKCQLILRSSIVGMSFVEPLSS